MFHLQAHYSQRKSKVTLLNQNRGHQLWLDAATKHVFKLLTVIQNHSLIANHFK